MSETRVCVKGLPKHLTDARLKEVFGEVGHVTDVKIVRTADGKSRLFGFVGFASSDETKKAVEHFNRTYIDTSLIQVELARGVNDPSLARPWSKYSEGSSRFVGKPGDEHNKAAPSAAASKRSRTETTAIDQLEKERDEKFAQFLKLAMPNKKLSEEKRTMPWENIEEEENEKKDRPAEEPQEELDDLAWLRAKQGLEPEQQEEKGGKKKKKKEEKDDVFDDVPASFAVRQAETTAKIAETRRLFVRNLPTDVDEAALRKHCSQFGELVECVVPLSSKTKQPKGYAIVGFAAPHEALQAYAGLDGQIFGGRLLHAVAGEAPRGMTSSTTTTKSGSSSFKKQRDLQQKQQQHTGNALYVNADTAAGLTAAKLGLSKAELLSSHVDGSVAVRAALAEAEAISDVKKFLEQHGVVAEALAGPAGQPSDEAFLVKNLPIGTTSEQLEQLYAPFGDLGRVLVVPGGSLGLVEFQRASEAQKAYRRTAFSNWRGVPLYLQWAPLAVFSRPHEFKKPLEKAPEVADGPAVATAVADDDMEDTVGACSVFVKNLAFATTEEDLRKQVGTEGVRSVRIVSKNGQSLGYGFIEFASKEAAVKVMKQLQGFKLDGHALELAFSKKGGEEDGKKKKKKKNKRAKEEKETIESAKLVIRNVPFEASKKELQQLMGAYGSLKSLRLPLKFDRSHRGYAFAEYQSKSEARKALSALEAAHLYGRHLVIEYAHADDEVADIREKTAKKFKE